MIGPGPNQLSRRFLDQIAANVDGGKKRLPSSRFQVRIEIEFLLSRAATQTYECHFSLRELRDNTHEGIPINPRKFRIRMNRRMPQIDLPPQFRLPRRDVEQLGIDSVGVQRRNCLPLQRSSAD